MSNSSTASGSAATIDCPKRTAAPRPQSRGDEARLRILEAAIEEFAAHGYRGAGTRQLAEKAGVNLGALTYYFGGKPNLYRASLEHVIARIDDVMRPMADRVAAALAGDHRVQSREEHLLPLFLAFLDEWLDVMLGRSSLQWQPSWSLLLTRAEMEPLDADFWPYRSTYALVLEPCAAMIARIVGRPEVDDECRILGITLLGQASAFRRQLDGQFRALGWALVDNERRDAIRSVLHRNAIAALEGAGSVVSSGN
jgi:TetR/AcrR family transcriptional regulator, regulator of cefoperazone and chloramphenicol sensitivity